MAKLLDHLKHISDEDRRQIEQAEEMFGADPSSMGFVKNLFWGRFRADAVLPYPEVPGDEKTRCDRLLEKLDDYLRNEHPTIAIDQRQEIPPWVIGRLTELGVLRMIIPREYGGGGFSVTSYNRALERIGQTCGSTAVLVSAHLSIGCAALMLFGSEEQRRRWLPQIANGMVSAFCLSEPNVGCDAGGQETRCEKTDDGEYFLLNGEKKWATSAALSGFFTVMAQQKMRDPKSGEEKDRVTALIVTPDMEGVDIFSRNRAKCGIRGTWQARIKFTDVKVPKANLLYHEGRGLNVALTCLNWGRCTLSAGMVGAGRAAYKQALKWARYRYQFDRPIGEFEQTRDRIAKLAAYVYAMDAVLYMTTGIVDRQDEDLMVETAVCKLFCSELGFLCADHAMQIMGGEGYMTENELERLWRDSRINRIVEGANEVMHTFIFGYGSKQLGEYLLGVRASPLKAPAAALRIAAQLFVGVKPAAPEVGPVHPRLRPLADRLGRLIREFSHQVKMAFKDHEEALITRQNVQARLSWSATWLHAMSCTLARFDRSLGAGTGGDDLDDEQAVVEHVFDLGRDECERAFRALRDNTDATMRRAADAAWKWEQTLPNGDFYLPEKTPDEVARGAGKAIDTKNIVQFGSGSTVTEEAEAQAETARSTT